MKKEIDGILNCYEEAVLLFNIIGAHDDNVLETKLQKIPAGVYVKIVFERDLSEGLLWNLLYPSRDQILDAFNIKRLP